MLGDSEILDFGLMCQEVRGQSMIIVGKLPPARVEVDDKHVDTWR